MNAELQLIHYLYLSRLRGLMAALRDRIANEQTFLRNSPPGYEAVRAVGNWAENLECFGEAFAQFCSNPIGSEFDQHPVAELLAENQGHLSHVLVALDRARLAVATGDNPASTMGTAVAHLKDACDVLLALQMQQLPGVSREQIQSADSSGPDLQVSGLEETMNKAREGVLRACGSNDVVELCMSTRWLYLVTRIALAAQPGRLNCERPEEVTELALHQRALHAAVALEGRCDPVLFQLCVASITQRYKWLDSQSSESLLAANKGLPNQFRRTGRRSHV